MFLCNNFYFLRIVYKILERDYKLKNEWQHLRLNPLVENINNFPNKNLKIQIEFLAIFHLLLVNSYIERLHLLQGIHTELLCLKMFLYKYFIND